MRCVRSQALTGSARALVGARRGSFYPSENIHPTAPRVRICHFCLPNACVLSLLRNDKPRQVKARLGSWTMLAVDTSRAAYLASRY